MPNRKGQWAPFQSLQGYSEALREKENQRRLIEKPSLSEDKIEEINEALLEIQRNPRKIYVKIHRNGEIKEMSGIGRIKPNISSALYLEEKRIWFKELLDIQIIEE